MATQEDATVATTAEQSAATPVRQLTREETLADFDDQVRRRLGIGGEEFARRLQAGEYDDIVDDVVNHPGLMYLAMLAHYIQPLEC